jgi:hypothetical protein
LTLVTNVIRELMGNDHEQYKLDSMQLCEQLTYLQLAVSSIKDGEDYFFSLFFEL